MFYKCSFAFSYVDVYAQFIFRTINFLNIINIIQVSEKRWYWLKVFALATIRDWDALEKFSKEKRPPIGQCFRN